jgi:hypothetical protein
VTKPRIIHTCFSGSHSLMVSTSCFGFSVCLFLFFVFLVISVRRAYSLLHLFEAEDFCFAFVYGDTGD